jgi:hypothetical protein
MREVENVYKILIRKPEGKRPLKRSRHRKENNNRIDLMKYSGKVGARFTLLRIWDSGRLL